MYLGSLILYNDVRTNEKIEKKLWKLLITNGLLKYLYIYITFIKQWEKDE